MTTGSRAMVVAAAAAWAMLLLAALVPAQAAPPDASRLAGGISSAAAPAYPEGDARSLSLTLGGALRTTSESAAGHLGRVEGLGAEGGAVARPLTIGARDSSGNARHVAVTDQRALLSIDQLGRVVDDTGVASFLVQHAFTSVTTAGAAEITALAAQGATNSVVLVAWIVTGDNAAATTLAWESNESDAGITAPHRVPATAAWTSNHPFLWAETADNQALILQVGAAATWNVDVWVIVR